MLKSFLLSLLLFFASNKAFSANGSRQLNSESFMLVFGTENGRQVRVEFKDISTRSTSFSFEFEDDELIQPDDPKQRLYDAFYSIFPSDPGKMGKEYEVLSAIQSAFIETANTETLNAVISYFFDSNFSVFNAGFFLATRGVDAHHNVITKILDRAIEENNIEILQHAANMIAPHFLSGSDINGITLSRFSKLEFKGFITKILSNLEDVSAFVEYYRLWFSARNINQFHELRYLAEALTISDLEERRKHLKLQEDQSNHRRAEVNAGVRIIEFSISVSMESTPPEPKYKPKTVSCMSVVQAETKFTSLAVYNIN